MKTIDDYMNLQYKMEIVPDTDEGGYVVCFPELPGCISVGDSLDDALDNALDAKREWILSMIEDGNEIPLPDNYKASQIKIDNDLNNIITESFSKPSDKEKLARSFRYIRMATGMNRKELSEYLHIPYNTMRDWEQGLRSMPPYVLELIIYKLKNENKFIV